MAVSKELRTPMTKLHEIIKYGWAMALRSKKYEQGFSYFFRATVLREFWATLPKLKSYRTDVAAFHHIGDEMLRDKQYCVLGVLLFIVLKLKPDVAFLIKDEIADPERVEIAFGFFTDKAQAGYTGTSYHNLPDSILSDEGATLTLSDSAKISEMNDTFSDFDELADYIEANF